METFFALLAICGEGNPPVKGGFPSQRPVTRSFDVFFDLCLSKWLSKQPRRRWFETHRRSLWLWCHCNEWFLHRASLVSRDKTDWHSVALVKYHTSWFFSRAGNTGTWALFQYPIRRLILRSYEDSKQRVLYLKLSNHSEIDKHLGSTATEAPVKFQSDVIV